MNCRHCQSPVNLTLVDLGSAPPSNAYLTESTLHGGEKWFPLKVIVCESCWLVQAEAYSAAHELFDGDYAYFSSFSAQWLRHAEAYVEKMSAMLSLTPGSMVVEVASNDGYLLQYVKGKGIDCLGIEPTASTAAASRKLGIETLEEFFGVVLAEKLVVQGFAADLTAANNVLAHVPDINDFAAGFATLLKPDGVATFEFPHLLNLIRESQFDTIYHEHFSYLSLQTVRTVFAANGLSVFDAEELPTHGGSLRVFAQRADTGKREPTAKLAELLEEEERAGVLSSGFYAGFQAKADKVKNDFMAFLISAKREGRTVAAYGAAAKGNTLMNYAGVRPDLISFVADLNPAKQGKFMPGSRIPIVGVERIAETKPDYMVILPWNLVGEVRSQLSSCVAWGAKTVVAVPQLTIEPL
jgi:SAM-dependent methyltransferase